MKKIKIYVTKNGIQTKKEIQIKKVIVIWGITFCIHRPYNKKNGWSLSEYSTGLKCSPIFETIKEAEGVFENWLVKRNIDKDCIVSLIDRNKIINE